MNEDYTPLDSVCRSVMRELFDWVEASMTAVVCVVLIFTFVARMAGVDGDSMCPTLHNQNRLIITRLFYSPKQDDIVVITKPNFRDEPLIKRIIAVEGQTIDIDFQKGIVYVDGVEKEEGDYVSEPTYLSYDMEFPATVPPGCVFVMGDNRNNSWDSRDKAVGMVDSRYILGRVLYRVLPYNDMGVPK